MSNKEKSAYVRRYFDRLTASEISEIIEMFEPTGEVDSPYLGKMLASEFFAKLGKASQQNKLTVFDVLIGEKGESAAAHFEYDWTLASGDKIVFQGIDYFKFSKRGKFASMSIFYDTHPTRDAVGDKYAGAEPSRALQSQDRSQGTDLHGGSRTFLAQVEIYPALSR